MGEGVTALTDDQLALLKEMEARGGSRYVAGRRYFDFAHLENLGLVRISTLAGREFHCAITDKGRAAATRAQ
jgi:hypothetical protein